MLPRRRLLIHLLTLVLISTAIVTLVDLWHQASAGTSFFAQYISHQLQFTIVEGRDAAANRWAYYLNAFVSDWPWWPFVVLGVLLVWNEITRRYPPSCLAAR